MSDDTKRQALSFLKTLVGNLDEEKWPSDEDGVVTYVESFRIVKVWRGDDDVFAQVATNSGTEVTLAGNEYQLVRDLAAAVGVGESGDGA